MEWIYNLGVHCGDVKDLKLLPEQPRAGVEIRGKNLSLIELSWICEHHLNVRQALVA